MTTWPAGTTWTRVRSRASAGSPCVSAQTVELRNSRMRSRHQRLTIVGAPEHRYPRAAADRSVCSPDVGLSLGMCGRPGAREYVVVEARTEEHNYGEPDRISAQVLRGLDREQGSDRAVRILY